MTVVQPRFQNNLIDPILLFQLRQILDITYTDVARRRAYPIIEFIGDDKERHFRARRRHQRRGFSRLGSFVSPIDSWF